ncbi:MAG: hypothetical protein ACYCW6_05310 [Candidatus Xenobia bacterium]
MSSRSGITWERRDDDGRKVEVNARYHGGRWEFTSRRQRNDEWQLLTAPLADDYDELIDAVERRVQRGQIKPGVLAALKRRRASLG